MAKRWKSSPASHDPRPPETISGIARRYHACAVAFASTLGIPLAEALQAYHGPVTAIFIETSRAELRLPATVTLPPLAGGNASATMPPQSPGRPEEVVTNGDPRPTTIPLAGGLPCGGEPIATLKPGALSMLRSKVASLVHAEGDRWVPLLSALQREKARRQEPGRTVPVVTPPEAAEKRPELVRRIKDLQPETSQRAIAEALGVSNATVSRDLAPVTSVTPEAEPPSLDLPLNGESVTDVTSEPDDTPDEEEAEEADREAAERQRWLGLSRRSMRAGVLPSVWEALRGWPYEAAERLVSALEAAPTNGTAEGRASHGEGA